MYEIYHDKKFFYDKEFYYDKNSRVRNIVERIITKLLIIVSWLGAMATIVPTVFLLLEKAFVLIKNNDTVIGFLVFMTAILVVLLLPWIGALWDTKRGYAD